ncbi:MAG: excinuclease ABC subunit UvrC [candidate division Zixibacteria bacterium]|nr:excinuclease ABC subunit UvrC [candidate division Zixibacteria bacterium]
MSDSEKQNLQNAAGVEFSTKLKNISDSPGVYLFKNAEGKIIYIGKAKSLKKRVRSYFSRTIAHPRTQKLVSLIADIETLATDTELEALILESNLIKENQPRYNVNLKDDKRYPYIKITNEIYPRLLVVRQVKNDKAKYFGPYTQAKAMRWTLKLIRKIFPVRSCNLAIPSPRKYKVCLDYFIGKCPGCCEPGRTTPDEYNEIIEGVILMLSGRSDEVVETLTAKMMEHSDRQEFEKAAAARDQIRALQSIIQKQKVVSGDLINRDIIVVARAVADVCIVVLQIRKGILIGRQHFYLTAPEEAQTGEILSSFIIRYYKTTSFLPSEIYTPEELEEPELIKLWFLSKKSFGIKMIQPKKGEKFKLIRLAEKNAKLLLNELLAEKSTIKKKPPAILLSLQRDLYLKTIPRTIAACDISNLGDSDAVGSVIFFSEAKPLKKGYRRFKIKTVEGQDDYSMMAEVVGRYFNHLAENNMDYPDLLLIDGGKGQLGAALNALSELGITSQQCASLAKQFEEVYLPGRPEPISIPRTSSALRLLQHVRDEAHRFAINYHRKLRSKNVAASELDNIPGVGDKRKYILLGALGSVEAIKNARLQDILNISGIPKTLAVKIYEHFHSGDTDE